MKHMIQALLIFVLALSARAVDTISLTGATDGTFTRVRYNWTSDSGGNATGVTTDPVPGVIFGARTSVSSAAQPSNLYDAVVYQQFVPTSGSADVVTSTDLLGGDLANLPNTLGAAQVHEVWPDSVVAAQGKIRIQVTNAGNARSGTIEVLVARNLRIQQGEASIPMTGGALSQILQFRGPGQSKFVTMSGEATIDDGGAVTLQGSPTLSGLTLDDAACIPFMFQECEGEDEVVAGVVADDDNAGDGKVVAKATLLAIDDIDTPTRLAGVSTNGPFSDTTTNKHPRLSLQDGGGTLEMYLDSGNTMVDTGTGILHANNDIQCDDQLLCAQVVAGSADIGGGYAGSGATVSGTGQIQANGLIQSDISLGVGTGDSLTLTATSGIAKLQTDTGTSITLDAVDIAADTTVTIVNSNGSHKANLYVEGTSTLEGDTTTGVINATGAQIGGGFGSTGVTISNGGDIAADGDLSAHNVVSGGYNPTITGTGGFSSISALAFYYQRIGDKVNVFGAFSATTSIGANTALITLPVASDFGSTYDCVGVLGSAGAIVGTQVVGDSSANKASVATTTAGVLTGNIFTISFEYNIL